MKKLSFFRYVLALFLLIASNAFSQVVGGRGNGQSAPQEVKASELSKGGFTSDVSLFSGAMSSGYSLGSVTTPGGLSFSLDLNYSSSVTGGDNVPVASGIPYGEGWSLAIPTISITTEAWSKYTIQQEASALASGTDNNRLVFSEAEAKTEGELYYFSPHISIPGVVNENFIFKYYDSKNSEAVFVPNKFETYIEARFTQNNWRVILPNGDVYSFGITQIGVRNASNQRVGFDPNNPTAELTDNGSVLYNLVIPQEEIFSWYCTSIYNPNASSGQRILLTYEQYGKFDYYKEYLQPRLEQALRGRVVDTMAYFSLVDSLWHNFFAQPGSDTIKNFSIDQNTYSTFTVSKDIQLVQVASLDWYSTFERIELKYKTQFVANTVNMLLPGQTGVARKDSLYNYAVVYSQGLDASELAMMGLPAVPTNNTNFSSWWRYGHIKSSVAMGVNSNSQGDFSDPNNPYIGIPTGSGAPSVLFREAAASSSGLAFNHSFLESPRIGQTLPAGDLYEVRTLIYNNNVSQTSSDGFCNFDINIVSGSAANGAGSQGFNLWNNSTNLPEASTWMTYHRETVFSTFNQAIKWNSLAQATGPNQKYMVTSNMFVMPNLPTQYNGFNIQVGPANSDNDFSHDFTASQTARTAAATYWNIKNYPTILANQPNDLEPCDPIRNNFGVGLAWHMVRKVYGDVDDGNHTINAPRYNFWWKDVNDVSNYSNTPTRADQNVSLNALVLIRYSKNPYMLTEVNHYMTNGEVSENSSGEILVSRLKLTYEVQRDTALNNRIYPINSTREAGQITNVYLLKKIQQVPVNSVVNGPVPTVNDSLIPTTHFVYTKLINSSLQDTIRTNASAFVLTKITDPLGGVVTYEYYPLNDTRTPIVNRYKVRQTSYAGNVSVHKAPAVALQITPLVKSKTISSETDATNPKRWDYNYTSRVLRSEIPALPDNFRSVSWNLSFGFIETTVTEPALQVNGARPQTKVTHYSTEQNGLLFGAVMKQEVFDENGFIISKNETQYGVNMAYKQGMFRTDLYIEPDLGEYTMLHSNANQTSAYMGADARATSHYIKSLECWRTNDISDAYRHSYFVRPLKTISTEYDQTITNPIYNIANEISRPNTSGYGGNQRTSGTQNLTNCGSSNTAISTITTETTFEYWDADSAGRTTSNGYKLLIDFGGNPYYQLGFEPSWNVYRTTTTSPNMPDAWETQEIFHHYDQKNFYLGAPYTFDALYIANLNKIRSLPYEQRTTSKAPGQAPIQSATFMLYDYRWNQNPDEINPIRLDTISGPVCTDTNVVVVYNDTCIKYIGQPPSPGMTLMLVNGELRYCYVTDPNEDPNNQRTTNPSPNDPPPPVPNIGYWLAGKLFLRSQWTQVDTIHLVDDVSIDPTAAHILRFTEVQHTNTSSYDPVWPYQSIEAYRITKRNELGLEKEVQDAQGVLTHYWYRSPQQTWHVDLQYPCNSYMSTVMRERGLTYAVTTGYTRSDSLRSEVLYNIDFSVDSIVQPNGEVLHYTYDMFGRMTQAFLNGKLRSINNYHYWNNNTTATFAQRGAMNYVESYVLNETNSTVAERSRAYVDPLGRKNDILTQISPNYLTNALDSVMVHSGQTDYDNWSRAIRQYKPFKEINANHSPVAFQPRYNSQNTNWTQLYTEAQLEGNARNRTMRTATFGENIAAGHTTNTSYHIISGSVLVAETGMSAAEYQSMMPVGALSSYRFRKQTVTDEDGKRRCVYSDAFGHQVASKAYISGTQYAVTLYFYDSRGQVVKVSNPIKEVSTFKYNLLGLVYKKTTPNNGTCKYMYNIQGNLVLEQDANGAAGTDNANVPYLRRYKYDVYGRLIKQERCEVVGSYGPLYYADFTQNNSSFTLSASVGLDTAFNYGYMTMNGWQSGSPYDLITNEKTEKQFYYDTPASTPLATTLHANIATFLQSNPQQRTKGRLTGDVAYNATGQPIQYHLYSYTDEGQAAWEIQQFSETGITSSNRGICGIIKNTSFNLRGALKAQDVDADVNGTVEMQYAYTYDGWGRMQNTTLNGKLLADYKYDDALGLVKQVRYWDEIIGCSAFAVDTIRMTYDARDRMTGMTSHFYDEYLYYDAAHPQVSDTSFRVAASQNFNGNINATKSVYKLNRSVNNPGTFNGATIYGYQYDGLNRLTVADASIGDALTGNPAVATPKRLYGDESYTYDKAGNILKLTRGMYYHASVQNPANWVQRWDYKYQSGTSKLLHVDSGTVALRTYTYDANGNTRTDNGHGLTSSTMNRANLPVTSVVNGKTITNLFGIGDGRVYKENVTDGKKTFYWLSSGGQTIGVLVQQNNNWNQSAWEFYAGGVRVQNGVRHFSVSDHLGNKRVTYSAALNCVTGVTYTVDQADDYYPFGKTLRSFVNLTKERYTFNGNEREEESLLDYFGARNYDSEIGRFTSIDPKEHEYIFQSTYAFAENNPVCLVDINGEGVNSTHTDWEGKVLAVYNDGDNSVYKHIGILPEDYAKTDADISAGKVALGKESDDKSIVTNVGQTKYWDEFLTLDTRRPDGQILFGNSWESAINSLHNDAMKYDLKGIANRSKLFQAYDLKSNKTYAQYGPLTGKLLDGYYVSARSAGNYLAGWNGRTGEYMGAHINLIQYMKLAGLLNQGQYNVQNAFIVLTIPSVYIGEAPYFGEDEYSGRWIVNGWNSKRK